jgi:sulfite reductase (NADPH) flavoprotein alpha-component
MVGEGKLKQLHELIAGYSHEELVWINGYLSGIVAGGARQGMALHRNGHEEKKTATKKISLVYGTETGNSKKLAISLAAVAKKRAVQVKLVDLSQYRLTDLLKEEYFFVVISTQGEGEPPIPAKGFYDHILESELSLPNLKYSVLALGDSSYPLFCKTGTDVDTQFSHFGARQIVPIQICDVDYEEDARQWFDSVLQAVENDQAATPVPQTPVPAKTATGKKFYNGTIITNINLNDRESNKETYHIEIQSEEPILYEPGDTIGIVPPNRQQIVEKIIELTGADPNHIIETTKQTAPVTDLLTRYLNIFFLMSSTVKKYAAIVQQDIPDTRLDLLDLLRIYPVRNAEQFLDVVKILLPISSRLYSVSSSAAAHGENEVHITVAKNRFKAEDKYSFGLCSEFLGEQPVGMAITFYVHKDKNFKLPAADKDVIMIGPGTGVAPFRSFLAHRDATGATGRNWYFFGEQHFSSDFLYQTEMQQWVQTGVLTRLELAFSRDQEEKIYVQHRMKQKASELFDWIDNGAFLFISGTKDPMSKDVENTLLEIIRKEGKKTGEEAIAYLKQLKEEGRYEKDVY